MFRPKRVCVIALAATLGLLGASCKESGHRVASFATTTTTTKPVEVLAAAITPPGVPAPTPVALAAVATGPSVGVHPEAGSPALAMTLTNPTIEGVPLALFVVDRKDDWLQVRLPVRPNGSLGWVKSSEVSLSPVDNRIVISTGERSLRVLDKNQQTIYETNVAVGAPSTPTPLGRFYVDIWLPNPGRPYGSFMLSIAGFSDVLKTFAGGRGQVAMHGWADTSVMGKNVSHGCVRMRNVDIAHLSEVAPLGTPVEIIA